MVCSTFAIFVPHPTGDMNASRTGVIHLQGLLITGVERNCSRNAVYSWLFCQCMTFLEPGRTQRGDETFPSVLWQTRPTCFPLQSPAKMSTLLSSHHIRSFTFFCLRVCDLQVAVAGSELLPLHDEPLQLLKRDVRAVKNHRVGAPFRCEFIVYMSHVSSETGVEKSKKSRTTLTKVSI